MRDQVFSTCHDYGRDSNLMCVPEGKGVGIGRGPLTSVLRKSVCSIQSLKG